MKWLIWSALAVAIVTHIIIPWHNVFQSTGVVLATPDAYSMLYCADNGIYSWEGGVSFFASIIVAFGQIFHLSNVVSETVLPVILFFLTLIPLYIISKTLFNKSVAIGSLVIYCLLPGELLERTKLGAGDYHCWEIFIFTTVMMLIVLTITNNNWRRWLFVCVVIFILLIYQMALLKVLLAPIIVIATIGLFAFLRLKGWSWKIVLVTLYSVMLIAVYLALPDLFCKAVDWASINLTTITNEMMPLFFTAGQFDTWITVWNYFGATFFLALFGLGWILYQVIRQKGLLNILFFTWTVVMLWLTIAMRRSAYYFATNIAILTSLVIYEYGLYWVKNNERLIKYTVVIVLIVCAPLLSISIRAADSNGYAPSQDWQRICQWLSTQDQGSVFTEWNYGYWIMAIGNHQVASGGGGPTTSQELIAISTNSIQAIAELKKENMKYIIIDKTMVEDNIGFTIQRVKAKVNKQDTFIYKLYYLGDQGCQLVYWQDSIKVFKIN